MNERIYYELFGSWLYVLRWKLTIRLSIEVLNNALRTNLSRNIEVSCSRGRNSVYFNYNYVQYIWGNGHIKLIKCNFIRIVLFVQYASIGYHI